MKKIPIFLVAIIISINSLYAQGGSCLPDCFDSPFGTPIPVVLFLPQCSCYVTVDYSVRHACDTWYDYSINAIHLDQCSGACLRDQYNNDIGAFINIITQALLVANPALFPPLNENDPCENNWRVMKGSCWYGDFFPSVPVLPIPEIRYNALFPCIGSSCCLEYFKVCWVNGVREITQTGYQPPADPDCSESGNPIKCKPVCGTIYR